MKAFIVNKYGKNSRLRAGQLPAPDIGDHDVLVRILASGVNPLDAKIMAGEFKLVLPYKPPFVLGNDLATLPDFPAEIRAPAGTVHGVSAFQIHFASRDILTPGDSPNVLVAMNPAALITQVGSLEKGGTVIVNEDGFTDPNLRKAGYESNPLEDGALDDYQLFRVPMTSMTVRATEEIEGISSRDAARCKNLFALGLVSWMYGRPTEPSVHWVEKKFADKPSVRDANLAAFRAGYNFGETAELFDHPYEVRPADLVPLPQGVDHRLNPRRKPRPQMPRRKAKAA